MTMLAQPGDAKAEPQGAIRLSRFPPGVITPPARAACPSAKILCMNRSGAPRLTLTFTRRRAVVSGAYQPDEPTAASTASACPLGRTLRQICVIIPLGEIKNVLRSTPMYLRPYMLFSVQTP